MFDVVGILNTYGYIGMFVISFLESGVFFLLPGDSLLFATGLLASEGYLNLYLSMFLYFTGSFLGSLLGYYIGDKLEDLKTTKYGSKYLGRIFKEQYLKETRDYFEKRGMLTIILCRFIPIVRTFVPVVAGAARMNYKKFVIYDLIGALIWSVSLVWMGYFFGKKFPWTQEYLEYIILFILLVTTFPVMVKMYKKFLKKNML
jgi:membrane-associated protein